MANVGIYQLTDTWNNGATTFNGIKLDVTDTASASDSKLLDLQVGGVSKFNVDKDGRVNLVDSLGLKWASNVGVTRFGTGLSSHFQFMTSGAAGLTFGYYFTGLRSEAYLSWASTSFANISESAQDLRLYRDAANTLAQRNGVNAQTYNLYNTYTDSSNYERGFMRWNSNVLEIGTEAGASGGVARELKINAAQTISIRRAGSLHMTFSGYIQSNLRHVMFNTLEHSGTDVGLYGATPVAQAAHIADPTGGATTDAEARTAINAILVALENIGITAAA